MNEINEKIKQKRMKDIRYYCIVLVINIILLILFLMNKPSLVLLWFLLSLSSLSAFFLYREINIYRNPTKNLIYKRLSYIGNKEEIDSYVDNQIKNCLYDDEYIRLTPEFLFVKDNYFDIVLVKDINNFSMSTSTYSPKRQILIYINRKDGTKRFITTLKKATEDNLLEMQNKINIINQKLSEANIYNNN